MTLPVAVSFLALIVLGRVLRFYGGLTLALKTRDQELHKLITYWPLRELIDELLDPNTCLVGSKEVVSNSLR